MSLVLMFAGGGGGGGPAGGGPTGRPGAVAVSAASPLLVLRMPPGAESAVAVAEGGAVLIGVALLLPTLRRTTSSVAQAPGCRRTEAVACLRRTEGTAGRVRLSWRKGEREG